MLDHSDIANGGRIDFEMGVEPNLEWGTGKEARPYSIHE